MITTAQVDDVKTTVAAASDSQKAEIAAALGLEQPVGDTSRVIPWVTVLLVLTAIFFWLSTGSRGSVWG